MNKSRGSLGKMIFIREYQNCRQLLTRKQCQRKIFKRLIHETGSFPLNRSLFFNRMNQEYLANYRHQCQFHFLGEQLVTGYFMNLTETTPTFRLHAASLLQGMRSACFCDLPSFSTAVIDPLASSLFRRFLYSSLSLFRLLGLVLPELHVLPYMCTIEGHDHVMTSGDDIRWHLETMSLNC